MIRGALAFLLLLAAVSADPARAAEHVTVGTMRDVSNGALFLADARGYFKDEGLDVDMTAYSSEADVAEAVAAGATDFGLGAFTPKAFNFAGRGYIKAIAAQIRERRDFEGNVVVATNAAFANGIRNFENLAHRSVAIDTLGSQFHYQLAQIARIKKFELKDITLKVMQNPDAVAREIAAARVDAAVLPLPYARELLNSNQASFIGWYSELDEQQLGALFVSTKVLESKRAVVEKFLRAYRRGVLDYGALLALDHGKRASTPQSREAATAIARYVYPGKPLGRYALTVEGAAYYMDPHARLDPTDITRQIDWYKEQGFIDKSVDVNKVVDTSMSK